MNTPKYLYQASVIRCCYAWIDITISVIRADSSNRLCKWDSQQATANRGATNVCPYGYDLLEGRVRAGMLVTAEWG